MYNKNNTLTRMKIKKTCIQLYLYDHNFSDNNDTNNLYMYANNQWKIKIIQRIKNKYKQINHAINHSESNAKKQIKNLLLLRICKSWFSLLYLVPWSFHTCCMFMNVFLFVLLFGLPFCVYVWLQIHCGSAFARGPLRNTLLLRTTRMRSQLLGRVSGVAALQTNKQTTDLEFLKPNCEDSRTE